MTWIHVGLASIVGVALLAIAWWSRSANRTARPDGSENLPMTPLQKRAWIGLIFGVIAMIGLVAVLAIGGLDRYDRDPAMRFSVYALLGAGCAIHFLVLPRNLRGEPRPWADERDLRIFERAPAIQGLAVLLLLAAWAIGLTETYHSVGSIPIVYPSLIFLSAFFVHMVSVSFGVLLGYRRGVGDG